MKEKMQLKRKNISHTDNIKQMCFTVAQRQLQLSEFACCGRHNGRCGKRISCALTLRIRRIDNSAARTKLKK